MQSAIAQLLEGKDLPREEARRVMDTIMSGDAILPATRVTKTRPMLWSNTSSTGTRESAQDSTAAKGSCFSTVFCFRIARSSLSDVNR